jgi:hypothetical protein
MNDSNMGVCSLHEHVEVAVNTLPTMKQTLDNVYKTAMDIHTFLNGMLDRKGFITTTDERLWRVEEWIKYGIESKKMIDNHNGKLRNIESWMNDEIARKREEKENRVAQKKENRQTRITAIVGAAICVFSILVQVLAKQFNWL